MLRFRVFRVDSDFDTCIISAFELTLRDSVMYKRRPAPKTNAPVKRAPTPDEATKMALACAQENIAAIKQMHGNGLDFAKLTIQNLPALHSAIRNNQSQTFKTLLALGVSPEIKDAATGSSAINYAASLPLNHTPQYVSDLVKHGANVNQINAKGYTPLNAACQNGAVINVKILLDLPQVDVNIPVLKDGWTFIPVDGLIRKWQFDLANKLIAHPKFDANYHLNLLRPFPVSQRYVKTIANPEDHEIVDLGHELKVLGLKFDLNGCYSLKSHQKHAVHCLPYELDYNEITLPALAKSYDQFHYHIALESHIQHWGITSFDEVHHALEFSATHKDPLDYYHRAISGDLVIIPSGWSGHSIYLVMQDNLLYRSNRGDHSDGVHGIEEFTMIKRENLKPAHFDIMLKASGDGPSLLESIIRDELVGIKTDQIKNPSQIAGNCPWTSGETGVEASFIASFKKKGVNPDVARDLAKKSFHLWEEYDLSTSLKSVIEKSAAYKKEGIYDDLLLKVISAHHDVTNPGDIYRGAVALNEISNPVLKQSFPHKGFMQACQNYLNKITQSKSMPTLDDVLHIPKAHDLEQAFAAVANILPTQHAHAAPTAAHIPAPSVVMPDLLHHTHHLEHVI